MKKSTRFLAVASTAAMALSLVACGDQAASDASGNSGEATGNAKYTVGICQLLQHPALDQATKGFQDALVNTLGEGNVTFDMQNANNDIPTCSTIINSLVSGNVDLILANATPCLQAADAGAGTIPVIGTSITDYATALAIDDWTGATGKNISGTSDLAPLDEQANLLKEIFPDAENVGILYCSGEPNSVYQVEVIEGYLTELGYTCTRYSFTDSNDLSAVVQTACSGSDVLYTPTDNTIASNMELIANIVLPAKMPVITGEKFPCASFGVATLSIDYYKMGYQAGIMAYDVLANGADISTMEIQTIGNAEKLYNAENCELLGIAPPEGYRALVAE